MDRRSRLERDFFLYQIMVGDCPRCGSSNTHDCQAPNFVPSPFGSPEQIVKMGSECWVARELDDLTLGHCDDCGYLWCLECGSPVSIDEKVCGHWEVCGECSEENGYLTLDEIIEKVCTECEYWDDGCQLDGPLGCETILEYECPYEIAISECPTIIMWKEKVEEQTKRVRIFACARPLEGLHSTCTFRRR